MQEQLGKFLASAAEIVTGFVHSCNGNHCINLRVLDSVERGEKYSLFYHTDQQAFSDYVSRNRGKTILATDQDNWSTTDIIAAYHAQSEIEEVFRMIRGNDYLDWQPMFHWTDSKIRVHGLS